VTTKLSSEAVLIRELANNVWREIELLDEAIVRYIDNKGGELLSYRGYFDKRFPALTEKMRGIDMGITDLLKED
jgi:hypothetical protein